MRIAHTYSSVFEYHYDCGLNQLVYNCDHNKFSMRWPPPLAVENFDNGLNFAIQAIVIASAKVADTLVCTLLWGEILKGILGFCRKDGPLRAECCYRRSFTANRSVHV